MNDRTTLIVTPTKKEGECTKAICDDSIAKSLKNVNILVTGSSGQLASEIKSYIQEQKIEGNFHFLTKDDLDITDKDRVNFFIKDNDIDIIINTAAYTAVDQAESDEKNANKINNIAVKNLANIAKTNNIKLIHISTDYVFDGKHYKPYIEDDKTNPNAIYGKTKLDGEKAMLEISPKNSIIIRTSWVYSSFGSNFVKTMLKLGKTKESLAVINDQVGTPTYAKDLACAILDIIPKLKNSKPEIYNYSNEGVLSWYDFAKEIMKMAKLDCIVEPIATKDYPTPAIRPHMSLLDKSKIKKDFGVKVPYWKDSLSVCLVKMGERR
jgi:dTDP-4-dehydrorhamnose reductase